MFSINMMTSFKNIDTDSISKISKMFINKDLY